MNFFVFFLVYYFFQPSCSQTNAVHSGLLPARGALRGGLAVPSLSSRPLPLHQNDAPLAVEGDLRAALFFDPTSSDQPSHLAAASKCGGGPARAVTVPPPLVLSLIVREEQ